MFGRIARNWVYGSGPMALVLLALTPVLMAAAPLALRLAWLALPVYMLHQFEEHDADRFRLQVNAMLGAGHAGLDPGDVAVINIGLVWVPLACVIWLVARIEPGWAVVAGWLLLVNALTHIGAALATRQSNPGLVTAILLFLPLGAMLVVLDDATLVQQAVGVGVTLAIHAAIVARALRPARQPDRQPARR